MAGATGNVISNPPPRLVLLIKNKLIKIAVLGAESTGKSWLCERLAQHFNTVCVPEYAREYFNDSDIYNYILDDLITIARKQLEMEDSASEKASGFLFCDTTLITLKIWAELEFGLCPREITDGIFQSHYDLVLLTENDVVWQADPLRQNKHSREKLLELNLREVKALKLPYKIISGLGEDRLNNAVAAVESHFSN